MTTLLLTGHGSTTLNTAMSGRPEWGMISGLIILTATGSTPTTGTCGCPIIPGDGLPFTTDAGPTATCMVGYGFPGTNGAPLG